MNLQGTAFRTLMLAAATVAVLLVGCLRSSEKIVTVTVTRTVTVASDRPPEPTAQDARIEGRFIMNGTPIKTRNIETPIQDDFRRIWRFTPRCDVGACKTQLKRQTQAAAQVMDLEETGGVYTGVVRMTSPGRCAGRAEEVNPGYKDTVRLEIRVSDTQQVDGRPVAEAIRSRLTIVGRRVEGRDARCLPEATFQEYRYDGTVDG